MARHYPKAEIDRVKTEISLQRLAEASGIELKRHGAKDLAGHCPFHDDRTPSLIITPATNEWHCMGACNEGGDVIRWVMKTRGVSFPRAMELLKADHPALTAKIDHVVRVGTNVTLDAPFEMTADDKEVLLQVVDYYHRTLKQSPEALRYLESRGLTHPEMIGHFKLGFANRTLGYRLPAKNRKAGAEMRGRLERLGIFRAETGHEHFNGSIVIPIFDASGTVVEMYGRKITRGLTKGLAEHLYLPGPHHGVWNEEALIASKEIILCEALIDALTFWCAGYRNVTSSYGVNGFTGDHREAFQKHGIVNVWIAYDRDSAGDRAAEQLKEELAKLGIGSHRVLFPKGMDANAYALKVTPASQSLGVLLNRAEWWSKPTPAAAVQTQTAAKGEIHNTAAAEILPEETSASIPQPVDVDEELLNRCFVLSVNEDRAQTQAVHRLQREQQTLEGLLRREERREILKLHRNAQRLLQPIRVVNPYAKELRFPDGLLRTRRDHIKYLTLIRAIAFLYQHQRPLKTTTWHGKRIDYIEATPEDIAVANRLVSEVLGRSLDDLRPETRRMLMAIDELVTAECRKQQIDRTDFRFSRRQVREHTGWSATQVRIHMERLQEMEYLVTHRGGRGQSFVYELAFEASDNGSKPQLPGLIHVYDTNLTELKPQLTDSKRGQNGGVTAGGGVRKPAPVLSLKPILAENRKNARLRACPPNPS
jgi:DNA primase catalytic core